MIDPGVYPPVDQEYSEDYSYTDDGYYDESGYYDEGGYYAEDGTWISTYDEQGGYDGDQSVGVGGYNGDQSAAGADGYNGDQSQYSGGGYGAVDDDEKSIAPVDTIVDDGSSPVMQSLDASPGVVAKLAEASGGGGSTLGDTMSKPVKNTRKGALRRKRTLQRAVTAKQDVEQSNDTNNTVVASVNTPVQPSQTGTPGGDTMPDWTEFDRYLPNPLPLPADWDELKDGEGNMYVFATD